MDAVNRQFRLAARPVGLPKPTDWDHTEEPVPEPADGEVLVQVQYLSLDPAMRGLDERGPLLHPARRHRRGDARGRVRRGDRLPASAVSRRATT